MSSVIKRHMLIVHLCFFVDDLGITEIGCTYSVAYVSKIVTSSNFFIIYIFLNVRHLRLRKFEFEKLI